MALEAEGGVSKIGLPGRAIGVFEEPHRTGNRLSPGDSLVLYTDGVVEARSSDGSFFGEERLASLLRSSISLDAETLADLVESAILDFQENDPRDDIAVLVLRVPE